jgi:Predicted transcriptional regulators
MTIGEKIKCLRQKNDITQEKLAEYLNITYQSISKWENNNAMPDVSLIVPLANFFGVSIDELFDRTSVSEKKEINDAMWETQHMDNKGLYKEKLALWRGLAQKYPNNYKCLEWLASELVSNIFRGDPKESDTYEDKANEAISICERILRDCTDNSPRSGALQSLVMLYENKYLSVADEEKAVKYANMANSIYCCKEVLLRNAYFKDESRNKAKSLRHNFSLELMDFLCDNLYDSNDSVEVKILARQTAIKLWSTLIDDGKFLFYHNKISYYFAMLARDYARLGKRDEMFDCLNKSLYHAKSYDAIPEGENNYMAVLVSAASCNILDGADKCSETAVQSFINALNDQCYNSFRNDPEFIELITQAQK